MCVLKVFATKSIIKLICCFVFMLQWCAEFTKNIFWGRYNKKRRKVFFLAFFFATTVKRTTRERRRVWCAHSRFTCIKPHFDQLHPIKWKIAYIVSPPPPPPLCRYFYNVLIIIFFFLCLMLFFFFFFNTLSSLE